MGENPSRSVVIMKLRITGPHSIWWTDGEVVESNKPKVERFVLTSTAGCRVFWDNTSPFRRLVQLSAVQKSVEPGSTVRADRWSGYEGLSSKRYDHVVVRQDAEVGDNLLPLPHRVAALLRRWIGGTHQGALRASHLDYYLDEYMFRFNRRTSRSCGKLFYRLVQQVVAIGPVISLFYFRMWTGGVCEKIT